jgi:hypothetical protein
MPVAPAISMPQSGNAVEQCEEGRNNAIVASTAPSQLSTYQPISVASIEPVRGLPARSRKDRRTRGPSPMIDIDELMLHRLGSQPTDEKESDRKISASCQRT